MILALVCIVVAPLPPPHTPPIMPPPKHLSTNNHQQQTQAPGSNSGPETHSNSALHAGSVSDPDQILFDPWDIDA
ncbi:hypothetical protein EV360DRAFT_85893 [Lentinula raphanica]|nr:hypothetical protein EV360DRAFT_85893 [Lentinula raphanica]